MDNGVDGMENQCSYKSFLPIAYFLITLFFLLFQYFIYKTPLSGNLQPHIAVKKKQDKKFKKNPVNNNKNLAIFHPPEMSGLPWQEAIFSS